MTLGNLLFSFRGRIGRKAFWFAFAISIAVTCVAALLNRLLFGSYDSLLTLSINLVMTISSLAVSAKRWHDRDKSAWWLLLPLIPLVGVVWTIVETGFLRGTPGPNRFGPDPLS